MIAWLERAWRWVADRRVECWYCGDRIGYVARDGHADWACAECSGSGKVESLANLRTAGENSDAWESGTPEPAESRSR